MALSFKSLLKLVESKTLFPNLDQDRKKGGFRWKGPHFSVFAGYVLSLGFYCNQHRFSDLLRRIEDSAYLCCETKDLLRLVRFLETMDSVFPELGEFFAVPKAHQILSGTTPKRNEVVTAFINFLVEAVEAFLGQAYLSPFIIGWINFLLPELKFLLVILGDTPFRCAQLEETKNILAEIESIANEAGLFVHSFFFTTDLVRDPAMAVAIYDLLPKFEKTKRKIEKHCFTFLNMPCVTTPNTALVSVFTIDSVLDYLDHLINNEACLIAVVEYEIKTLCEELHLSRSFVGDIELKQDEEIIIKAMQLTNLAHEAEYILTWFVTGEVPIWYISLRLFNFIQKSKLMRTAIPEIKLTYGTHNLQLQVVESPRQLSSQVSNNVHIDEEIIVGLDDETMKIASQLIGGPDHLQMISITGMPGVGKTTLAKKLYSHSPVVKHFDQRLWCVVSQTYRRTGLLIDILCSITNLKEDELLDKEDSKLGDYLHKSLKKRRYLIVMDDTWDIQSWIDVSIYFPKDNTGSKVLFTTRNRHLAPDAIINELPLQSADQCWDLLQHKIFRKSTRPPELEKIGKKIAASCKGLPLVVAGIAAVLANMDKKESSWRQVSESLTSYISKDQDILELSYKHLPIHLKPCFLYFSAFKEDKEIPVKKLLSLWISEGFIRKNKNKRSEEIADEYLIELINRNMVQVAQRRSDNGVKACTIHDLMRDMALRIAEQKNFVRVLDGCSLYEQHHRLCNHSYSHDIKSRLIGLHIRSLFGISMSSFNASHLRLVRVLQSENIEDHIDNLIYQLRYLEIPYVRFQMSSRIKNLEFLLVTGLTDIGPDFSNMPRLRHLKFKYPSRFIEHMKFSQNYCLETLSGVELHNLIDQEILRCFPNLRRLKCYYEYPWNHDADVSFLTRLESLSVLFSRSQVKFSAINFATNIKKLSVHRASFEIMSSIGKLPNLEILKLVHLDFKGENWNTDDDEFQKLKFLKLRYLKLENWITSEDHFPMVERLVLENCKHLQRIPLELGYVTTLQMIEVHSCNGSVAESALEIQKKQQEECGNEEMQVIINGYAHG